MIYIRNIVGQNKKQKWDEKLTREVIFWRILVN